MSEDDVNKVEDTESKIGACASYDSSSLVNNTGTYSPGGCDIVYNTIGSGTNGAIYVTGQFGNQNEATQKLLKELIAEIKDLKEEGAQQEHEIEQIKGEFEEFKGKVRLLLDEYKEASNIATSTGLLKEYLELKTYPTSIFGGDGPKKLDIIGDEDIGGGSVSVKKKKRAKYKRRTCD